MAVAYIDATVGATYLGANIWSIAWPSGAVEGNLLVISWAVTKTYIGFLPRVVVESDASGLPTTVDSTADGSSDPRIQFPAGDSNPTQVGVEFAVITPSTPDPILVRVTSGAAATERFVTTAWSGAEQAFVNKARDTFSDKMSAPAHSSTEDCLWFGTMASHDNVSAPGWSAAASPTTSSDGIDQPGDSGAARGLCVGDDGLVLATSTVGTAFELAFGGGGDFGALTVGLSASSSTPDTIPDVPPGPGAAYAPPLSGSAFGASLPSVVTPPGPSGGVDAPLWPYRDGKEIR